MIIYCEQPVVYRIAEAIELVKQKYDHEGIGFFIM